MPAAQLVTVFLLAAVSVPACAQDPPLTAEAIMARVAANQDRSDKLRGEYVYRQHIHIATRKGKKLMREESADYRVTPMPDGTQKQLTLITGRYWHKGQYVEFKGEPVPDADGIDGDLIHDFRNDLQNEHSKDGFARDYFPLTTEEQKKYRFRLMGEETLQGRKVYHLGFRPKDKQDFDWAGEAYIDAADFQPVTVFTKLSRQIPFLVRTFLADLPGVGFNVQYRRQPDGVWFPSSFRTEFRLRILMFLSRDITVSLENTDFEHTHVESRITPDMQ
ncbi:MAG TPA: hypothetical protein VKM93_12155 [Terriglobia bacterium]|nr:hypothetical protein [Terriglobia bacterium]